MKLASHSKCQTSMCEADAIIKLIGVYIVGIAIFILTCPESGNKSILNEETQF